MVDPFFNTIHIFYTLNLILTNLLQDQTNIGLQNYFIWAVLPRPGKTTYLFEMCGNSKNPLCFSLVKTVVKENSEFNADENLALYIFLAWLIPNS
jgi:hypothetical protein